MGEPFKSRNTQNTNEGHIFMTGEDYRNHLYLGLYAL